MIMATTETTQKKTASKKSASKTARASDMLTATVFGADGKKNTTQLPEHVFGLPWNNDLVHQVVTSMRANQRRNTAHTKDRGDVRGGGKKPWRQKGTGRARHGSIRSPIWIGGGVTFGPRNERNYTKKINRKQRVKALFTVLSAKLRDGQILFVDDIALSGGKTKEARETLTAIAKNTGTDEIASRWRNAVLIATPTPPAELIRGFRNISGVDIEDIRNINPLVLLGYKYVLIARPEESVAMLEAREQSARTHGTTQSKEANAKS